MKIPCQSESVPQEYHPDDNQGSNSPVTFEKFQQQSYSWQTNQNETSERFAKICINKPKWLYLLIVVGLVVGLGLWMNHRSAVLQAKENIKNQQILQKAKRQKQQQQVIERQCTKHDNPYYAFFFLNIDKDQMPKQQAQNFQLLNDRYCHFHLLFEIDFDLIVDLWNSRQELLTGQKQFINKTTIKKQDKKALFIFLQQYFWGGIYVHTSFGLKFQNRFNEKFISKAKVGRQVFFAQADRQNQKGILLPKRDFKALRVDHNFSVILEKMIRKIIAQEDWIDVCQAYQCGIMKNAIKPV